GSRCPPNPRVDQTQRRKRDHRPRRSHSETCVIRLTHLPCDGPRQGREGDRTETVAPRGGRLAGRHRRPGGETRRGTAASSAGGGGGAGRGLGAETVRLRLKGRSSRLAAYLIPAPRCPLSIRPPLG